MFLITHIFAGEDGVLFSVWFPYVCVNCKFVNAAGGNHLVVLFFMLLLSDPKHVTGLGR